MYWPTPLQPAIFLRRANRFRAEVLWNGRQVAAHVPNSGRLGELLRPGAAVWVAPAARPELRKTAWDLVLAGYGDGLVSVDARLPNRLVAEALASGSLPPFQGYPTVEAEVRHGGHRLDFRLAGQGPSCWLEAKSVTLVEGGVALFPDAPTERGVRHLEVLANLRAQGLRAAVLFVVQREDAGAFRPHATAHPQFAQTLDHVSRLGVEIYAWRCRVDLAGITLTDRIAVLA